MKSILRKTLINSLSIWLTSLVAAGFTIAGGAKTIILAGFVLFLIQNLLKPIIQILTLPLNFMTLGLFSWVINVATLYLLTVLVSEIKVKPFTFHGFAYSDFVIQKIDFNLLGSFIVIALTLTIIQKILRWLTR